MSALEWAINITKEYLMFVNLSRFSAVKGADQKDKEESRDVCQISWAHS